MTANGSRLVRIQPVFTQLSHKCSSQNTLWRIQG